MLTRVAVLNQGASQTGVRAASTLRHLLGVARENNQRPDFEIVDPDLAQSAAAGTGLQGSLNLTLQQARDLGAAIGCDFYFIGDAQTFKRSPSAGPAYYESYATIFLVSARSGRLVQKDAILRRFRR